MKNIIPIMLLILCLFLTSNSYKPSQRELASKITIKEGYQIDNFGESTGETYSFSVFCLRNQEDESQLYWEIIVWQDDEIKDILCVEEEEHGAAFPSPENMVLEYDINFDGKNEILICLGGFGTQGSVHYKCYLTIDDKFIHCPSFSDIPNPSADEDNRQILASWRNSGWSHGHGIYIVEESTFVMTERLTDVFEQESDGDLICIWTDEILENGEWVVRDSFCEDELSEEGIHEKVYAESSRWALGSDRWVSLYELNYG